jgi:hypothetical protein
VYGNIQLKNVNTERYILTKYEYLHENKNKNILSTGLGSINLKFKNNK